MGKRNAPIIIDVEASGFGSDSYPIEVGVALEDGTTFCCLVRPAPQWTYWDESAERVHCLSRAILESHGTPVAEVAASLNALLDERTVYSDGWVVDQPWLITLFHAARVAMQFRVSPLESILTEHQMARWHATKDDVMAHANLVRHRASHDAWLVQETFRRAARGSGEAGTERRSTPGVEPGERHADRR